MNTPEQLELAADILRHKKPWQYRLGSEWRDGSKGILSYLHDGVEIQIKPVSFPPKPEQFTWHNPENVSAEELGEGWRFGVVGETLPDVYSFRYGKEWRPQGYNPGQKLGERERGCTIRLPLSTPYPDGSYVKDGQLVKPWVPRYKVGDRVKVIASTYLGGLSITGVGQVGEVVQVGNEGVYQVSLPGCACWYNPDDIEPAPWTLSRHLPGFRPLRDGEEWHRQDWTEEMLPEGWRPHLKGEYDDADDEVFRGGKWEKIGYAVSFGSDASNKYRRTRRPLPEPAPEPKPVPWSFETRPLSVVWVYKKGFISDRQITAWKDDSVEIGTYENPSYQELLDNWLQRDGSPCGVVEPCPVSSSSWQSSTPHSSRHAKQSQTETLCLKTYPKFPPSKLS